MSFERLYRILQKWFVPTASAIVVFGAFFGVLQYIVRSEVADLRSSIGTLKSDVGTLRTDVGKTGDRIDGILSKALERAFPAPKATQATIRKSLGPIKELLQLARDQQVTIEPTALTKYGNMITDLTNNSKTSTEAWQTMIAVLNYRSFLSADSTYAALKNLKRYPGDWYTSYHWKPKEAGVQLEHYGIAPPSKAAKLDPIGIDENANKQQGDQTLLFSGGEILLDDMDIRNVIFRHVHVIYYGGPVRMENILFADCTFTIAAHRNSQLLAEKVLTGLPITFKTTVSG